MVVSEVMGGEVNFDNIYFSQEGEDIILSKMYYDQKEGFYVDIGAHHPIKFSNTYKYYLQGWRGINIDAMPNSMKAFYEKRSRDINLEVGVSERSDVLSFYIFDQPGLNTFDEVTAKNHSKNYNIPIKDVVKVQTFPLSKILDEHMPSGVAIDFMSIDVEGLDLVVLKSNNWNKYRPTVILIECIDTSLEELLSSDIHIYLVDMGYKLISKTFHTVIYKIG